jgi:hypothetical protein
MALIKTQDYSQFIITENQSYLYKGERYALIGVLRLNEPNVINCCVCKKSYKIGDFFYYCREKNIFFCDNDKCYAEHKGQKLTIHSDQFVRLECYENTSRA